MAAQQHQLLQAANAQHMAAMVALEAMQKQATVSEFSKKLGIAPLGLADMGEFVPFF